MHSGEFDEELKDVINEAGWNPEQLSSLSGDQARRLDRLYHRLKREIRPVRRLKKNGARFNFIKLAAVFAGFLVLAGGVYFTFYNNPLQTIKTAYGEIRKVVLSDGSTITLNANSELKFHSSWKSGYDREVWLEGEGYFSVTHKENGQKFIVHSEGLAIEVIGTEFNVNNRRSVNQVVLRSGRIKVIPGKKGVKSVVMKPGDLLEIAEDNKMILEKVQPEYFSAWKNGRMIFRKTPLRKIAMMIEDNYGIPVRIENKEMAMVTYTADIPGNKLEVLLKALSASYNIEIERTEEEIIFK